MQSRDVAQLKAAIREAEGVLTEGDFAEARKAPREEHAEARAGLPAALQSNDGDALQRALDEGVRGGLPNDKLEAAKPCQEVSLGEGVTTVQEQLHGLVSPEVSPEEAVTTAQVGAVALPPSPSGAQDAQLAKARAKLATALEDHDFHAPQEALDEGERAGLYDHEL